MSVEPDNPSSVRLQQLEAGLGPVRDSPGDEGVLEMIVRRPSMGVREVLEQGALDLEVGLVGDNWSTRGSRRTDDGTSHPNMQLNIMNARVIALIAADRERWQLAGDQLYVDLDLSSANLPPWTRIEIGTACIQITDQPHTGCKKFVTRFGLDAVKFVNSPAGRELNLRGVNARVVRAGTIRAGDRARVLRDRPATEN